jgi:peptide/nickel transport system permease protein
MAITAIPKRRPWDEMPGVSAVSGALAWIRRYPFFPLAVLFIVLVIPAIFADQIAPHDHEVGDLDKVKLPPAWIGDTVMVKTVVERVNRDNRDNELSLSAAQRRLKSGTIDILSGEAGQVNVGDRVSITPRPGGTWEYPLGTDKLGRDVLSRIIHGSRVSLLVATLAILLGGGLGTALGLLSAYRGGVVDAVIMRVVDIKLAFPSILLALVLVAVLGPSYATVIIVISILLWARYARVVRGEALAVKQLDFVDRARVAGSSNIRIMARHIFPNLVNTVVVLATLEVGHVIILESTLSFLGAGIPRPTPAWGVMVADGRELIVAAWWIFLFPCLAIVLTVLSMNLLGDWLRDKLDPKLRNV